MTNTVENTKKPILGQKAYDAIKQLAQYYLPGLAALYSGLAALWHFPNVVEVVGTIALVDTFLGIYLGIAKSRYDQSDERFDGAINVTTTDTGDQFHSLALNAGQFQALPGKDSITLKVNSDQAPPTTPVENLTDPRLLS